MAPVNNGSPVSASSSGVTLAGTLAERLRADPARDAQKGCEDEDGCEAPHVRLGTASE